MSLTINSEPGLFDNDASLNVTTSLTEGASYQNLRIKAELYYKGGVIAVKTLRKGISDFDFSDILRTKCNPFRVDLGENNFSNLGKTPSVGSNLLTGWTNNSWDTFTSSGRNITDLVSDGSGAAYCYSNTFSVTAGKWYSFVIPSLEKASGSYPIVFMGTAATPADVNKIEMIQAISGNDLVNGIYVFQALETSSSMRIYIRIEDGDSCDMDGSASYGNMGIYEIDDSDMDIFMSAPFGVKFTEVYENASDVTTEGDTEYSHTAYFFDLEGDIDDYICNGSDKLLLQNLPDQAGIYQDAEIQINFISMLAGGRLQYGEHRGSNYNFWGIEWNYMGFGVLVINDTTAFNYTDTFKIKLYAGATLGDMSAEYVFTKHSKSPDSELHHHLEWTNRLGGLMQYRFMGGSNEQMEAERITFLNDDRKKRLAKAYSLTRYTLFTEFKLPAFMRLIGEILESKKVYKIEDDTRTEIFVASDIVPVYQNGELIGAEIEIEQ